MRPAIDNLRGGLLAAFAVLSFACMGATAKLLGQRLPSMEVAFFRAGVALLIMTPFYLAAGRSLWRTDRLWLHLSRGALGAFSLTCGFYALTHLPLAEATALSFTRPLFQVILAVLILREVVRARRWAALFVGFFGVLLMVQPGPGGFEPAALVGLTAAVSIAIGATALRELAQTERHLTILAYLGLTMTLLTALPAAVVWQTPAADDWWLILLMGALGAIGQALMVPAYRHAEFSLLALVEYLHLPLAATAGYLLFAEWPKPQAIAGALLIAASTLYIARREAALARARGGEG